MGLIKNQYVARTFIQPTQELREQGVRMKLSAVRGVVKGKRVVVIDDSIVRGTTSKRIVQMLKEAGAAEVHMRISSPPLKYPSTRSATTSAPIPWRSCRSTAWWNPSALVRTHRMAACAWPTSTATIRPPWTTTKPTS